MIDKLIKKFVVVSNGGYRVAEEADKSEVRIFDRRIADKAVKAIKSAKKKGDTLGGVFEVLITGVPTGLGSYVEYDRKLDGQLAQAIVSIHAVKGVEMGNAFSNSSRFGSEVHDEILLGKNRDSYVRRTGPAALKGA